MAYQRKTGVPRTTTKHVDGYREKKLAQREIAGRAYALKTLKDAMYPIVKHNRYMELKRKGLMENLPDYFPTEEKLEQAYDAGDISLDNYYVFRGILREMNGVSERLPSREEVAERVLMECYDKIYKEMEEREVANMTDAERRSYNAKRGAAKRKEAKAKAEMDAEIMEEIEKEKQAVGNRQ